MLLVQKEVETLVGDSGGFPQEVGWFLLFMGLSPQGSRVPSASVSARRRVLLSGGRGWKRTSSC